MAMRAHKADAFRTGMAETGAQNPVMLTNCPSCLTGLGRNQKLGYTPRHLAEALAMASDGKHWLNQAREWMARATVVTF